MRRWITVVTAMIMLLPTSLWASTPAVAAENTLTVVSSASFYPGVIARGIIASLYTTLPVSSDKNKPYEAWVTTANGGLYVLATCNGPGHYVQLPILYVGDSGFGGSLINAYVPNGMGLEPWGTCANSGLSTFILQPAEGFGSPLYDEINTVATHPGIYSAGSAPSGTHFDPHYGTVTQLTACSSDVPSDPSKCRVRHSGELAELTLYLTGAEWYLCIACPVDGLIFELARVVNGVVGTYVAQYLVSVERDSMGVERAVVRVRPDLAGGEYRLRVRNSAGPDIPQPLPIWFGPPGWSP